MIPDILFEDKYIIVVNKPAGVPVETARIGEQDLISLLRNYLKGKGEAPEVYPVHRLDQPVSGLLVLAKTREAASKLSVDLQRDSFSKDYKARVYKPGTIPASGELRDYLVKERDNLSRVVPAGTKGAKEAVLSYELIEEEADNALLCVHLKTGRHHQIRVQLSHAGRPILGDRKYGTGESLAVSERLAIKNVALTAYKLKFNHPVTGNAMEFVLN